MKEEKYFKIYKGLTYYKKSMFFKSKYEKLSLTYIVKNYFFILKRTINISICDFEEDDVVLKTFFDETTPMIFINKKAQNQKYLAFFGLFALLLKQNISLDENFKKYMIFHKIDRLTSYFIFKYEEFDLIHKEKNEFDTFLNIYGKNFIFTLFNRVKNKSIDLDYCSDLLNIEFNKMQYFYNELLYLAHVDELENGNFSI